MVLLQPAMLEAHALMAILALPADFHGRQSPAMAIPQLRPADGNMPAADGGFAQVRHALRCHKEGVLHSSIELEMRSDISEGSTQWCLSPLILHSAWPHGGTMVLLACQAFQMSLSGAVRILCQSHLPARYKR